MLSTMHGTETQATVKWGKTLRKPAAVVEYNKKMGGLDRADQMIKPYDVCRKNRRWYIKLFLHFISAILFNCYVLYKDEHETITHKKFLVELWDEIVAKYQPPLPKTVRRGSSVDTPLRLTTSHFPCQIPPTEGKQYPTRVCKVCSKRATLEMKRQGVKRNRTGTGSVLGEKKADTCVLSVEMCHSMCFLVSKGTTH